MFRSNTQPVASRKCHLMPGRIHSGGRRAQPLDEGQRIAGERADPGVVIANGLVLWAVLSAVGIMAWRSVM
jgi:hypothetical protein